MPKPNKATYGLFDPCGHQFAPPIGQKGICPECGHCDACAEIRTDGINIEKVARMAYDNEIASNPEDYMRINFDELRDFRKDSYRSLARSVLAAIKKEAPDA